MLNNPTEEIKEAITDAVADIEDHVDEAEKHEGLRLSDEDVDKVADKVYQKLNKLVSDLLDAAEDAAEIAVEAVETPAAAVEEEAAEPATEAEPEEDIRPRRAHALFRKPMKKDE
jgi:uncharacterized protein YpuA (DUF1002 family)